MLKGMQTRKGWFKMKVNIKSTIPPSTLEHHSSAKRCRIELWQSLLGNYIINCMFNRYSFDIGPGKHQCRVKSWHSSKWAAECSACRSMSFSTTTRRERTNHAYWYTLHVQFRICTCLIPRLMTMVFVLGRRLHERMCTRLENGI